jgi:small subunit ribosomal protein S1
MRENPSHIEERRLRTLQEGDVVEGIVVSIEDYGAFVSLMGVDGLLHISELSWEHVDDVRDEISLGDKIEVEILSIDRDERKVQLSRKRLLSTPGLDDQIDELLTQEFTQ